MSSLFRLTRPSDSMAWRFADPPEAAFLLRDAPGKVLAVSFPLL